MVCGAGALRMRATNKPLVRLTSGEKRMVPSMSPGTQGTATGSAGEDGDDVVGLDGTVVVGDGGWRSPVCGCRPRGGRQTASTRASGRWRSSHDTTPSFCRRVRLHVEYTMTPPGLSSRNPLLRDTGMGVWSVPALHQHCGARSYSARPRCSVSRDAMRSSSSTRLSNESHPRS